MRFFRRRRPPAQPAAESASPPAEVYAFGYKGAWLAVRADDPAEVADALALRDVTAESWDLGIATVYAADPGARPAPVFVGEPVDGWVLVPFGLGSPDFDLAALSRRFGEVQRFATHRVVDAHKWERWVDGAAERRYGYLGEEGEVLFDEGEPTEHDEDVVPASTEDETAWESPDEDRVMEMAAYWSVDPTTLDERDDLPEGGLLGYR